MSVPNYRDEVAAAAARYPDAWRAAHTGGADTERFIRLLAADLHAIDNRIGLNGKRGNPNDISDDALCFRGEGPQYDPTNGNQPVSVIDVIGSAGWIPGEKEPFPAWGTYSDRHAGAWVQPEAVSVPNPGPVVPNPGTPAPVPQPVPIDYSAQLSDIRASLGFLINQMAAWRNDTLIHQSQLSELHRKVDEHTLKLVDIRDAQDRPLKLQFGHRWLGEVNGTVKP
jgi:hypothetical protein